MMCALAGALQTAVTDPWVPNREKKILIEVENLPVPFDSRVWKEACSLHKQGACMTVLCPGRDTQGYELFEGIHMYRHPIPHEGSSPWEYLGVRQRFAVGVPLHMVDLPSSRFSCVSRL
jgi:hypothetical protein